MNNESGMALIQVVVAATIMTILGLYLGDLIISQANMVIYLKDQLAKVEIDRNFGSILSNDDSCTSTLQGTVIRLSQSSSSNMEGLKDGSGGLVYESNTQSGNLSLGQMELFNESVSSPGSSGFVRLVLPVSRVRRGGGPEFFKPLEHRVNVFVDSGLRVTSCLDENNVGWQDVALTDTADFEEDCTYRAKLDLDPDVNQSWYNADSAWVNFIGQSGKFVGAVLAGSNYYGIESGNKASYGFRNSSGVFNPASNVEVTKMEKSCL